MRFRGGFGIQRGDVWGKHIALVGKSAARLSSASVRCQSIVRTNMFACLVPVNHAYQHSYMLGVIAVQCNSCYHVAAFLVALRFSLTCCRVAVWSCVLAVLQP